MKAEIQKRIGAGCQRLTLGQMEYILSALGYCLDRSMDCRGTAKNADGSTYPATTTGIKHKRSGLSFANVDAPRDEQFDKLQRFRSSGPFVVLNDSLLEI